MLGIEMATDFPSTFEEESCMKMVGFDMTANATKKLFERTMLKPTDVDVVELHDCFSANELITYEALGLCPLGKCFKKGISHLETYLVFRSQHTHTVQIRKTIR